MSPPDILLHINYFEQGSSTEDACRRAASLGADGIEFRRRPAGYQGTDLDYLDEVARAVEKHRLKTVSFGYPGPNLMVEDAGRRRAEVESAMAFYRKAASLLPLTVLNVFTGDLAHPDPALSRAEYQHHGSAIASAEQWEWAAAGFREIGALGEELGLRFAFETHGCYLHDSIEAAMRLVESIGSPAVGVLWDHTNLLLFPESPSCSEVITRCGGKLFYVHLKNPLAQPTKLLAMTSLSGGILNIREQWRLLADSGYSGPVCIEAPRAGDRLHFAREDLGYFRSILDDMREGW